MIPWGAILNAVAILGGGGLGATLGRRLPEHVRACIFQGLGLSVLAVGIKLSFQTTSPAILITSIVCGGMIGGALRLEDRITQVSQWLKTRLHSNNPKFSDGVALSVTVFCCGSLALLGPLDEGVRDSTTLLSTKAFLDGLTTIAFGSVYGAGVLLSAAPVLLYEGALTLLFHHLGGSIPTPVVTELSAVGGVLTMGIGINLLELRRLALPNMLPSLAIAVVLSSLYL